MTIRSAVSIVATLALIGCGGAEQAPEEDESVFDPLTETIDRAEDVQDTVNQQAEELRRQIEEQER